MKPEYNSKIEKITNPKERKYLRELRYTADLSQEEYDKLIEEQLRKQEENL